MIRSCWLELSYSWNWLTTSPSHRQSRSSARSDPRFRKYRTPYSSYRVAFPIWYKPSASTSWMKSITFSSVTTSRCSKEGRSWWRKQSSQSRSNICHQKTVLSGSRCNRPSRSIRKSKGRRKSFSSKREEWAWLTELRRLRKAQPERPLQTSSASAPTWSSSSLPSTRAAEAEREQKVLQIKNF